YEGQPPPDPPPSPYGASNDKRAPVEKPMEIRPVNHAGSRKPADPDRDLPEVPDNPADPNRSTAGEPQPFFPRPIEARKSAPGEGVAIALQCLVDKKLAEAVHHLERYDKIDQEALLLFLPWIVRFAEGGLNQGQPQEIEKLLEQIEDFSRSLRPKA